MDDSGNGGRTKDPTSRTLEQLLREIENLGEKVDLQFDGVAAVTHEQLSSVKLQFELVERQRLELKGDTRAAVDAALAAQQKAVSEQQVASETAISKSELAIKEQVAQLKETIDTASDAQATALNDIKARVNRLEGTRIGSTQAWTIGVSVFGILVVLAGVMVAVFAGG